MPLVEGAMVYYHTQKKNITLDFVSCDICFPRLVIYHNTLN